MPLNHYPVISISLNCTDKTKDLMIIVIIVIILIIVIMTIFPTNTCRYKQAYSQIFIHAKFTVIDAPGVQ